MRVMRIKSGYTGVCNWVSAVAFLTRLSSSSCLGGLHLPVFPSSSSCLPADSNPRTMMVDVPTKGSTLSNNAMAD